MSEKNPSGDVTKTSLYQEFLAERAEIESPFNSWVTGVNVGHSPSFEEKLVHFVVHGGAAAFRRKRRQMHPDFFENTGNTVSP